MNSNPWLPANWDAPPWIRAGTSTRSGGTSLPPFKSLNLATHVGDDAGAVSENRARLLTLLNLPSEPVWLEQLHGNRIMIPDRETDTAADGACTTSAGVVCTVMTADCIPLLLCNQTGTRVAAVHIGWRGFCAGIVHNALSHFREDISTTLAWIGPHIHQHNYEVGDEVRDACLHSHAGLSETFRQNPSGRWQASLQELVRRDLARENITAIFSSNMCTFDLPADFFSYRRDGRTGRMASMIWIDK